MTQIITHRGIDADGHHSYSESSREAFTDFLQRGFGIEFDVRITADGVPVISHDDSLTRISGQPCPPITEIDLATFLNTPLPNGHALSLKELIGLVNRFSTLDEGPLHALHLKSHNQTREQIDIILDVLGTSLRAPLLIFDIKPDIATYIRSKNRKLSLAASVAHPYDIARYNDSVGHTLMSLLQILDYGDLYDWAWLDEWDRLAEDEREKSLYNQETFSLLHENNLKIAVVSPELHATSPHLLGGECHPDATSKKTLTRRWEEIIAMRPDAICTDHPFSCSNLALHHKQYE